MPHGCVSIITGGLRSDPCIHMLHLRLSGHSVSTMGRAQTSHTEEQRQPHISPFMVVYTRVVRSRYGIAAPFFSVFLVTRLSFLFLSRTPEFHFEDQRWREHVKCLIPLHLELGGRKRGEGEGEGEGLTPPSSLRSGCNKRDRFRDP